MRKDYASLMSQAAHVPDGLLAPREFLGTSHRFLFKIGGCNYYYYLRFAPEVNLLLRFTSTKKLKWFKSLRS